MEDPSSQNLLLQFVLLFILTLLLALFGNQAGFPFEHWGLGH